MRVSIHQGRGPAGVVWLAAGCRLACPKPAASNRRPFVSCMHHGLRPAPVFSTGLACCRCVPPSRRQDELHLDRVE